MLKYNYCLFVLFFLFVFTAQGQSKQTEEQSNIIKKWIPYASDTINLDSLSIAPGSFNIFGQQQEQYFLDEVRSKLFFYPNHFHSEDSFLVTYRTLPIKLDSIYSHKSIDQIEQHVAIGGDYQYNAEKANKNDGKIIDFNELDYSGFFARSIAAGNNQNLSMNSQFNLQLNGYLLDSIKVEAAITDNNVPFQPEGNTQRLQEFDQVYITFEKNKHRLSLGDIKLEKPNNYFLNYNKRVQGLSYQATFGNKDKIENKVSFSGSMAKGQFNRNSFNGIEGNQGPYKLQGENGEQYFIVLAGSEKVFMDGELMQRGEDKDYVIDYNLAEVTFMPRRLITREKRIQIEFEYQARNYLNSLFQLSDELTINKKLQLRFNIYSNQDAKNASYNQTLSDEQKSFLATIGDSIQNAYYDNVRTDSFAANKILYRKIDTLVNGTLYPDVYVYSSDSNVAKFNPGFSYMGEGKGNYIISNLNTNGRSYQWVAPENGLAQGNYEPKILLITPKKLQVFSAGTTYQIDSNQKVDFEWAGSEYDPNTFSNIGNQKHWGNALRLNYEMNRPLKTDSLNKTILEWKNNINYEFVDNRFEAIAPFRNVEFNRDWNIQPNDTKNNEHLLNIATGLKGEGQNQLVYHFSYYKRGSNYSGNRNLLEANWGKGLMRINTQSSVLFSKSILNEGIFLRPNITLEHFLNNKRLSLVGLHFEKEQNNLRANPSDSLSGNAFDFDISKLYFKFNPKKLKLDLSYQYRRDFRPLGKHFELQNIAQTLEMNMAFNRLKNQNLSFNGSFRNLKLNKAGMSPLQDENTILGRLQYNANLLNNFFVTNLLYDFGTGQEQKRQFTFIEVPTGQGTHMWVDYNEDGIQQVNEFVLAVYPDQRKYAKMITPTNEYVKVNFSNFSWTAQLNPENLWSKVKAPSRTQKLLSRFSNQVSMQSNNRIFKDAGFKAFNPFAFDFVDSTVVSSLMTLNNTLYINRSNSHWGLDYTTTIQQSQALLTYGVESLFSIFHLEKFRWIINRNLSFLLQGSQGQRLFKSPLADGRTYEIHYKTIEPSLNFISGGKWRLNGSYKYEQRQNTERWGGGLALVHQLKMDAKWSMPTKGNLSAGIALNNINFNGLDNSPVGIVILESLTKGNNWIWNLNWTTRLSKYIELSIDYNGRILGSKTPTAGTNRTIHNGNMSLRAIL